MFAVQPATHLLLQPPPGMRAASSSSRSARSLLAPPMTRLRPSEAFRIRCLERSRLTLEMARPRKRVVLRTPVVLGHTTDQPIPLEPAQRREERPGVWNTPLLICARRTPMPYPYRFQGQCIRACRACPAPGRWACLRPCCASSPLARLEKPRTLLSSRSRGSLPTFLLYLRRNTTVCA